MCLASAKALIIKKFLWGVFEMSVLRKYVATEVEPSPIYDGTDQIVIEIFNSDSNRDLNVDTDMGSFKITPLSTRLFGAKQISVSVNTGEPIVGVFCIVGS